MTATTTMAATPESEMMIISGDMSGVVPFVGFGLDEVGVVVVVGGSSVVVGSVPIMNFVKNPCTP